ncbi:hypothetical protein TWF569_005782 [Orbilia oligospora]|uniref:Uncharacterized protein n=1 Tax=Orbilia oligospora TaxID=2813651 RepID=A0A7C8J1Z9_ORBOL|nr:hypothetical protein TWF102_000726 [Orbilia oligospora]KAF3092638.1 hypothetical protein TWF706_008950 [Orbilia oligospora]KAF3094529.1 hypothetical protein TWF103_010516 [Orbilia oligospora]KAF3148443.1 hypothetical protein TWF569_005782 [Orbilia oligospora]KAF3151473.1 hypothetical protein TWF594_007116 [Orbilia oligospora]
MSLPRRLQGCTHLFSFLSVLASSRNSIHTHSIRSIPRIGNRNFSFAASVRKQQKVIHGASATAHKKLQLRPEDRDYINQYYDHSKPKRLRTQEDFLNALRKHGYVPAIDRVDEMLDMNRSPFQSKDEFDKITLGLLLTSSKSANGEIRNPYKIPDLSTGQNPVRTRQGKLAGPLAPRFYFLFPDDTNWHTINQLFPLQEPPRPWHPIVMAGMKQDYTREEVARRIEWSQIQNAKKLRNGYGWAAPDPASYKHMDELPPPPPPVIRECNVCKKPRYLMRFWNFFVQRWQHVGAPHRPIDCEGHRKGGGGRLMYAPKGTRIGGQNPAKIEDKEWIEEETAVRLLFRSGFVALPSVSPVIGEDFARAAMNGGDHWPWIRNHDVKRWALRGGRKNGLIDLSKVNRMSKVEDARKEQQQQFLEEHAHFLDKIREVLKEHPITPENLAKIPPGQFYPEDHQAVDMWYDFEMQKTNAIRAETRSANDKKADNRRLLRQKLRQISLVLEEMKKTKAEILLIESGQGESWADPTWSKLNTRERGEIISSQENLEHIIVAPTDHQKNPQIFAPWGRSAQDEILDGTTRLNKSFTPTGWLSKAAQPITDNIDRVDKAIDHHTLTDSLDKALFQAPEGPAPTEGTPPHPQSTGVSNFSLHSYSSPPRPVSFSIYEDETETKSASFRTTPQELDNLYRNRFRKELEAKTFKLNPNIEKEEMERRRIKERLEKSEKRAIRREEEAFALKEAMLWSNTRGDPAVDGLQTESECQDKI